MGPLVRATEAGKVHEGNLRSRGRRIVIWRTVARAGRGGAEVSTSGPPKRVRAPSVVSSLVRLGPKESCPMSTKKKTPPPGSDDTTDSSSARSGEQNKRLTGEILFNDSLN